MNLEEPAYGEKRGGQRLKKKGMGNVFQKQTHSEFPHSGQVNSLVLERVGSDVMLSTTPGCSLRKMQFGD